MPMPGSVVVSPEQLNQVLELYKDGLCLQAYRAAQAVGPLQEWQGAAARVLGGRLAFNLGAPRLAFGLHVTAWRAERTDPEACYFFARSLFERRGPWPAWKFLKEIGELPDAPAEIRADWLAYHAYVLGRLRDFDGAEEWLARAQAVCPERPWICLEKAYLLEFQDRYAESLTAARRALEIRPWYRPGVQAVAHILQLLDRDQEAVELLAEADRRIESGLVVLQLAGLLSELRRYPEARQSYERYVELSPLLEKEMGQWLAARRSDLAYYCGDDGQAAEFARQVDDPFYQGLPERIQKSPREGRRVQLDVGFVRQHHQTCVPATLAALSRFWKMPAEHLQIAAEICYDGTPDHRERRWAEDNGWAPREFTVTWDSACAVIDRGIPFTLTTVEPGNAHLQAVIGYDRCRHTLLVRDPYVRPVLEFFADKMLDRYRLTGPRGMVLVPAARADILEGLELPDALIYDRLYRLQRALADHDRERAATVHTEMQTAAPQHRLTRWARRILAIYDADRSGLLASIDSLLELFPDDALLNLSKLASLRDLARRDERLALLQGLCAKKEADPYFQRMYAQELAVDAREHPTAGRLLRRALHARPLDSGCLSVLAGIARDQRRFGEALELDRFAACLEDKDEDLARNYFLTARLLKQTETALRWLQKRCTRFGDHSSQPARTLFWAHSQCERTAEVFAVLDAQLMIRTQDGDLKLFAAEAHAGHGNFDRADYLLRGAKGCCSKSAWLRAAAHIAQARGERGTALELWRQVIAAEPTAVDAQRSLVLLLAESSGRPRALEHLRQTCSRFPCNYPLRQLWIEWLRDDGPPAVEPVVRELIAIHPADAWAQRELALVQSASGRSEEALTVMQLAQRLEPASPVTFSVLGQVHEEAGRRTDAIQAYREAIRLGVDNTYAIDHLLGLCDTQAQRRDALAFVEGELVRQVIFGDGLWAYYHHAQQILQPVELLQAVQKALEARPDLWHCWSLVVRQLIEMERLTEAHDLARQATARFPLLPRLWIDLAQVCRARQDREARLHAIQQALQISPGWATALRCLAEVHSEARDFSQARELLEQAIAASPLDPFNHGFLAEMHWETGEKDLALEQLQQALQLEPGYDWAWNTLRDWAGRQERPEIPVQLARDLTVRRPAEARSWLMLAEALLPQEHADERLAALDRVLALNPQSLEAADLKAEQLSLAGRHEEAHAVLRGGLGKPLPVVLRGRAAWIDAQRGQLDSAITQMHAILADDPQYLWGWRNLTMWYGQTDHSGQYLEAANQLVELAPQNPQAYFHRGQARIRHADRPAAKADFRRAVELAPAFTEPAQALFDAQLADEEYESAARTLVLLKAHAYDDAVQACEVQLHARLEDKAKALDGYRQLTVSRSPSSGPLETATAALVSAGWAVEVDEVLDQALQAPDAHPFVAGLWVDRWVARGQWGLVDRLRQRLDDLMTRGELGRQAIQALERQVRQNSKSKQSELLERVLERYPRSSGRK